MKKLLILLIILGTALFFYSRKVRTKINNSNPSSAPEVLGYPEDTQVNDFSWEGRTLSFLLYKVDNIENLKLIPNFTRQLNSKEFKEKNGCKKLVSGGFYSEDYKPIGLFIYDYNKISSWQNNYLLNGALSVNDFGTPRISSVPPKDNLRFAIQTGPVFIENAQNKNLKIKNDKYSRRVIAVTTGYNELYFLVIYDPSSYLSGPELEVVPSILAIISEKTGIVFADAINLDGGSASAFYTEEEKLSEVAPVGSYFCLK